MVFNSPDEILLTIVTCISIAALALYTLYRLIRALMTSSWRMWHVRLWDIVVYAACLAFFISVNLLAFHEVWRGYLSHYAAIAIHATSLLLLIALQTYLFIRLDRERRS